MIKAVKGIIVVKDNYLLQLRDNKKNVYFPNFWGVFGGRVEKNETYHKALEREIKEETNLIVRVSRMILSANCKMIGLNALLSSAEALGCQGEPKSMIFITISL